MQKGIEIAFLYFLYKQSNDGKKMLATHECIQSFILTNTAILESMNDTLSIENTVHQLIHLFKIYRDTGYISIQDSKKLPFTNIRIEYENEEMLEMIGIFDSSEENVEQMCKTVQKKGEIVQSRVKDILEQFQQMSMEIESEREEVKKGLNEKEEEEEISEEESDDDNCVMVVSSDGKSTYHVNVVNWTCTCPSFKYSLYVEPTCKHIWKVYQTRDENQSIV
jgi:hypothetical protein